MSEHSLGWTLRELTVPKWQPIETAPKDKRILLHSTYPKARYRTVMGSWNAKFNEWQSSPGAWPMKPTHWQPEPAPPVT